MLLTLTKLVEEVGAHVLTYFRKSDLQITWKEDDSPVTEADWAANEQLKAGLKAIEDVPVMTEEEPVEYEARRDWTRYWLIDPIDGTREFIKGSPDFCVSVALIDNRAPVLGVLFAPALHKFYIAQKGHGAFRVEGSVSVPLPDRRCEPKTMATSARPQKENVRRFIEDNHIKNFLTIGSAIKFGMVAEGAADVYPRIQKTQEWDVGAGHIILEEAGGIFLDLTTGKAPVYNRKDLKLPALLAFSSYLSPKDIRLTALEGK